jgi:hypothetical protein
MSRRKNFCEVNAMQTSYYNTTHSTHPDLVEYETKAKGQEAKILEHFQATQMPSWSPSEIRSVVFNKSVPITSVRRGMTNLTNAGRLVKTDTQLPGPYGRPEYRWKLAPEQQELFQ